MEQDTQQTGPVLVLGPVEPPVGGVSRYARALAALLDRSGTGAVQLDLQRTSAAELGITGSPVRRLMKRVTGGALYALRSQIEGLRPRLVVDNHQLVWREDETSRQFRRAVDCPYVLVIHDGAFPEFARKTLADRASAAERIGWIAGAVSMSDAIHGTLADLVPGIRRARLSPLLDVPTRTDAERLGRPFRELRRRHATIVATSGALAEHYGLVDVLRAYGLLRERGREMGLVLLLGSFADDPAVSGALEETIARWGRDSVLALTDHPCGSAVIAEANVYVRASRVESFGLALHEAILAGVPVVAAAHPTRPAGVQPYEAGDVAGLAAAVERALTLDASERAALAAGLAASVERNRSATLGFLESCLS